MFNIRSIDLNLLPVFEAVYEEQSLPRAAKRLAMTQSAVSHAVTRLRGVFHDELFVRHSRIASTMGKADTFRFARVVSSAAKSSQHFCRFPVSPESKSMKLP